MKFQPGLFPSPKVLEAAGDGQYIVFDASGNKYVITLRTTVTKSGVRRTQIACEGTLYTLDASGNVIPGSGRKMSTSDVVTHNSQDTFVKVAEPTSAQITKNGDPRVLMAKLLRMQSALLTGVLITVPGDSGVIDCADATFGSIDEFNMPLTRASAGLEPSNCSSTTTIGDAFGAGTYDVGP